jgi:hypothetical protein
MLGQMVVVTARHTLAVMGEHDAGDIAPDKMVIFNRIIRDMLNPKIGHAGCAMVTDHPAVRDTPGSAGHLGSQPPDI